MLLSDRDLSQALSEGAIDVTPLNMRSLQPASIDLTLGEALRAMSRKVTCVDTRSVRQGYTELHRTEGYVLRPGQFVLGSTHESVRLGVRHAARVEGISSLGRLGLAVHITAGWLDPGFEGEVTLEMVNHAPFDLVLHEGMRIAQLAVFAVSSPVMWPYYVKGSYQCQSGPTESRYRAVREV